MKDIIVTRQGKREIWPGERRSPMHRWYHTLEATRRDRTELAYAEEREDRELKGRMARAGTNRKARRAEYKLSGQVRALRRALVKPRRDYVGSWLHPELDARWDGKARRWVFRHSPVENKPNELRVGDTAREPTNFSVAEVIGSGG